MTMHAGLNAPTTRAKPNGKGRRPAFKMSASRVALWAICAVWTTLVIVPLIILLVYSFFSTEYFQTIYEPSLETWKGLFASGRWEVTLRTLRIALTVTFIELAIGFPFALWLAKGTRSQMARAVFLALLTIPFFLDLSSRTIVWRAILGQNGLINTVLMYIGATEAPVDWLLYSEFSVHFGMIPALFPPMVLPIYMSITLIDDTLIEASNDLGATPAQTLWKVIMPLALPGIMAGFVFTLGPALAAWVEPGMLGGGFVNLLSSSIESAYTALRYPVVAALSAFVIGLLLLILAAMVLVLRRFRGTGLTLR
jgi:spermidine/putrescine transport system permease protein